MFCPNCGKEQLDNPKFCHACGGSMAPPKDQGAVATTRCAYHPHASSIGFCTSCGRAICAQCKSEVKGIIYCSSCVEQSLSGVKSPIAKERKSATGFVIGSIICAVIAVLFIPPLFGIIGIILGYFALRRDRKAGIISMILATLCMIGGLALSIWVWSLIP